MNLISLQMTTNEEPPLPPFESAPKIKADWTDRKEEIFIDLMVEKVVACGRNRVTATFSKNDWHDIRVKYYEKCKERYEIKAYKNKMNLLKERYKTHKKLMDDTTGLGWDQVLCTVGANSQWWDKYLKENPKAKRFRTKGCPEYANLCMIFGDTVSTRYLRASQLNEFNPRDGEEGEDTEFPSTSRYSTPLDKMQTDNAGGQDDEVQKATYTQSSDPINTRSGKRDSKGAEVNESLEMLLKILVEESEVRVEEKKRKFEEKKNRYEEEKKYTISECMKIMEAMELEIDDDAYIRVLKLLQDRGWRETFIHMSDNRRRAWITSL